MIDEIKKYIKAIRESSDPEVQDCADDLEKIVSGIDCSNEWWHVKIAKYLVIDTETSGLFDFSKPADAEGQPRMASIAMIYLASNLEIISESMHYIKPDGWTMPEEASKINGLTNEILLEKGEPIKDVLDKYTKAIDDGLIVVAFNAQYDLKILRGELRRAGIDDRFDKTLNICVMRAATDILKIPKKNGAGYKFPKLSEACEYFGIEQIAAHTALDDTRVCVKVFGNLMSLGVCPDPQVYFSKNKQVAEPLEIKI